jgi:hypothetical protein
MTATTITCPRCHRVAADSGDFGFAAVVALREPLLLRGAVRHPAGTRGVIIATLPDSRLLGARYRIMVDGDPLTFNLPKEKLDLIHGVDHSKR